MFTPHFLSRNIGVDRPIVAVFGSAISDIDADIKELAINIGKLLAKYKVTIATGGCIGIPSIVASEARKYGSKTMAFWPDSHEEEIHHNRIIHNNDNPEFYDYKYYFKGFSERSLEMIGLCDCAIVINGRVGTLSEWSMAVEEGLPTIVIKSGGITDTIPNILKIAKREFPEDMHFYVEDIESLEKAFKKIFNK